MFCFFNFRGGREKCSIKNPFVRLERLFLSFHSSLVCLIVFSMKVFKVCLTWQNVTKKIVSLGVGAQISPNLAGKTVILVVCHEKHWLNAKLNMSKNGPKKSLKFQTFFWRSFAWKSDRMQNLNMSENENIYSSIHNIHCHIFLGGEWQKLKSLKLLAWLFYDVL